MNSENKFTIIGRLTKDPILRETEKGTKVTNICVACEREYKGKDGNKIVDFLDFTLWDKNAENICNISKQGSLIYLEGYNITKNFGTEIYSLAQSIFWSNRVVQKLKIRNLSFPNFNR